MSPSPPSVSYFPLAYRVSSKGHICPCKCYARDRKLGQAPVFKSGSKSETIEFLYIFIHSLTRGETLATISVGVISIIVAVVFIVTVLGVNTVVL